MKDARIEFYSSIQSAYCYFTLDRVEALQKDGVEIALRQVLPGILRMPDMFSGRSELEQRYFDRDVARTAEFLSLPFAEPNPYPTKTDPDSLYVAAQDQPLVYRLQNILHLAQKRGCGFQFYVRLMRRVWSGQAGWDCVKELETLLAACGLTDIDPDMVPTRLTRSAAVELASNHQAMLDAGHWGVPCFVYQNEPFYGQDRLDQLRWRIFGQA